MDISVFQYVGGSIENMVNALILDGAANLMGAITPIVVTGVTIYLMVQGYLQIYGKTDNLAIDVLWTCLLVILITSLTLNVSNYTEFVVGGVKALRDGLTTGILTNSGSEETVYKNLDSLLQIGIDQAAFCLEQIGTLPSSWDWIICAVIIAGAVAGLTSISAMIVIGSEFLLTMLLIVGPIFIVMACFPITRRFIDNWMGKIFEQILIQLFGVTIISMAMRLTSGFITGVNITTASDSNPIGIAIQILIVCGILAFVIRQIPSLAASLSGGFASAMMKLSDATGVSQQTAGMALKAGQVGNQKYQAWRAGLGNSIGSAGAVSQPKHNLSTDLQERISAHNLKHK